VFRNIFRKRSFDRDLDEELQAHLEIEIRLLMDRGLSREEATARARQSFGNRTRVAECTREVWGWMWIERLQQDLHYATRSLRRSAAFSAAAVLSLALGVGASTAVFSIADTVFLRPLPYPHSDRLLWIAVRFPSMKTEFLASPDYVAWRRGNHVFEELAATQAGGGQAVLLNGPEAAQVHAVRVSSNFLATLGIRPTLGRDFQPDEELPDGPKAVLLSDGLCRQWFHARMGMAGQTIVLDGQPYTVAGVLPSSFIFPMDVRVDVITTLPISPTASHRDREMSTWAVYGRLKSGVSIAQARADLQRLFAMSRADMPLMFRSDTSLVVQPLQEHRIGNARQLLSILLGAVICLLLIACANVSNLLLERWSARSGELAVRAAIGAGRGRLARQLFTEAALLTFFGCALGTAFAAVTLRGFVHYAAGELPRLREVTMDVRVFVISLFVSIVTTMLFGALPALKASRVDLREGLEAAGRFGTAAGFRFPKRTLVVAEVALSLILLSGAALLLQTLWHLRLWHLRNDRLGFEPEHVLTLTIPLKGTKLEGRNHEAVNDLVSFARQIPGTVDAAQTECTPLSTGPVANTFSRADRPLPEAFHRGDNIHVCRAGDGYARASGIRVIRGRFFTSEDTHYPNIFAVINEAAARAYFPGEDPIGKRILGGPQQHWKTVIGVVSDSKNQGLDAPPAPQAFVNGVTWPNAPELQLILRSIGDPRLLQSAMEGKLRSLDPGLIASFKTLDQTIGDMTSGPRFNSILIGSFAAIAFLMAMIGVYGVLAFSVTQRTPEIGIRVALGAEPLQVFANVLREGLILVFTGVVAGFGGMLVMVGYLRTILYGVSATDPVTFLAVTLALIVTATIAACIPARRAASVDPMLALRYY